ncbi:Peptide chain release factor 2 [Planctomycetes bacterium LzC2]|uniref:Peptide chain release factor 2 n=2 Tax=Alienimonas chondri TaxID=2681879 RepID=A0ABX1VD56_9PLAN|nr:Peptide chain release factor 2 [Alienimonas chondri]
MSAPTFWDDQEAAQKVVSGLSATQAVLKPLNELLELKGDAEAYLELAAEDPEEAAAMADDLGKSIATLEKKTDAMELRQVMSAPEDRCDAFVSIQAGEGGTDAADWAAMLMRMYQRWAEREGYKVELVESSEAEEAGIRSATLLVKGDHPFGYLKGESGQHRLIRISPFDGAGRRQTSFAAIDVTPDLGDQISVDVDYAADVREDTMRAGGAGGQHVNKTESAIRLTHLPTGTVVQCQSQRSQHQNRAHARQMLESKLYQMQVEAQEAENAARRGEKSKIGFGGETIRNYVLHPDRFAKDTRTGHRETNPDAVIDGDLQRFIDAYLRWSIGE